MTQTMTNLFNVLNYINMKSPNSAKLGQKYEFIEIISSSCFVNIYILYYWCVIHIVHPCELTGGRSCTSGK